MMSHASRVLSSAHFPVLSNSALTPPSTPDVRQAPKVRTIVKSHVHWHNRSLMQRLNGFVIVDCGGGGNCLFLSVSELLRRNRDRLLGDVRVFTAGELREKVADFIRDGSQSNGVLRSLALQLDLVGEESDPSVRTLDAYAKHIRRDGEHASATYELPILAELLNLRVRLVLQVQGAENGVLGEEMRDRWVEPTLGLHTHEPLEVHILLLNQVGHQLHTSHRARRVCGGTTADCHVHRHVSCAQARHWQALDLSPQNQHGAPGGEPRLLFNLSVGLGTSAMRFKRQQETLEAFVALPANAAALDAMPYEMKTVPPPRSRLMQPVATELRRSLIAPHILGVFPRAALPMLPAKPNLNQRSVFTHIKVLAYLLVTAADLCDCTGLLAGFYVILAGC
jgi:hypothetical protein